MYAFSLRAEQQFDPKRHMERVLGTTGEGDVTIACWEPGQTSPYHCHPNATEIYFCFEGGGRMRAPTETIELEPGMFVVHPRGELHEYANGPRRTLSVPRALWRGDVRPDQGMAEQPELEAAHRGPRVLHTEAARLVLVHPIKHGRAVEPKQIAPRSGKSYCVAGVPGL